MANNEIKYLDEMGVRHLIGKIKDLHEQGVTGIRIDGGPEQHGVVDIDIPEPGDITVGDDTMVPIAVSEINALFE